MGDWYPDPHSGRWRYDPSAPDPDVSATSLRNPAVVPAHQLGTPRQEAAMTDRYSDGYDRDVIPSGPHVLDPTRGSDGGGAHTQPDTGYGQGAGYSSESQEYSDDALVACPACGTGVHRDRIRG